jgi:hypothetical protein
MSAADDLVALLQKFKGTGELTSTTNLLLTAANIGLTMMLLQKVETMSGTQNQLDTNIAALTAQVAANTTVEGSAVTLLNGIPAMITAAVAAATAAGATPAELAAVTGLATTLQASAAPLAAAVTQNTPSAGP